MLTEKDYCDYETCVALKELGFSEPTLAYYHGFLSSKPLLYLVIDEDCMPEDGVNVFDLLSNSNKYKDSKNIDAPTLWEAQKWLREKKGIIVYPQYLTNGQTWMCMVYEEKKMFMHSFGRGSYNEVLNEGIKETVKILKEKEFHNLRKAFYIDKSIVWIPQGKSHKEYFDSINHSDFIETKVRGYILNDTLSLYKGSDFSIPPKKEVENIVSLFASFNIKQINLGCNIGNIGEVWKPKEIIKLLKEEK